MAAPHLRTAEYLNNDHSKLINTTALNDNSTLTSPGISNTVTTMQFTTLTLLGLSALATALPTATILEPVEVRAAPPLKTLPVQGPKAFEIRAASPQVLDTRSPYDSHAARSLDTRDASLEARDVRAAIIFKSANVSGESTFIPANNYCANISVVPGGLSGKIKSLSVEKGRKCDFYQ